MNERQLSGRHPVRIIDGYVGGKRRAERTGRPWIGKYRCDASASIYIGISDESFDCLPCIVGSNTVHAVEQSRQLTVFREKFNGYIPRYRGTFGRSEAL
jgi:hypothetical protein